LRYEVDSSGAARHLLVELPPSQQVTISVGGRTVAKQRVSAQGVLSFVEHSTGKRTIEIRPR